jgi:hypothetical protein
MVLALLFAPSSVRHLSGQSPVTDAQAQAERDVDSTTWLAAGCLLGVIGWFIATQHKPEPPATALLGKSPDYVAQYRDAYKEQRGKLQSSKAFKGCLVGTAASVLVYVLAFAAASDSDF